MEKKGGQNCN